MATLGGILPEGEKRKVKAGELIKGFTIEIEGFEGADEMVFFLRGSPNIDLNLCIEDLEDLILLLGKARKMMQLDPDKIRLVCPNCHWRMNYPKKTYEYICRKCDTHFRYDREMDEALEQIGKQAKKGVMNIGGGDCNQCPADETKCDPKCYEAQKEQRQKNIDQFSDQPPGEETGMITEEEFEILKDRPEYQQFIQDCVAAGVDPIKGLSFAKDFIDATKEPIENIKIKLELEYGVDVHAGLVITILGPREQDPLVKELLKQ